MLKKKIIINFDSENMLITENEIIVKFIPSVVIRKKSETPLATSYGDAAFQRRHSLLENEVYCTPFSNGKITDIIGAKALFKAVLKDLYGSNHFISIFIIINGNLDDNDKNVVERIFISLGYNKIYLVSRNKLLSKLLEYNSLPLAVYCDADITELVLNTVPAKSYTIDVSKSALAENLRSKFLADNKIKLSIETSLILAQKYCSLFPSDLTKVIADGKDTITAQQKSVYLNAKDLYPLVNSVYSKITDLIAAVIMDSDGTMARKIVESGILFLGSGIQIEGFEEFIYDKLHLKSIINKDDTLLMNLCYNLILEDYEICE